uniref:Uncharacterized protein n=1 Tax=Anguilla anguilla TaxID=7936 RepID=A0A0E9PU75_ANGAN
MYWGNKARSVMKASSQVNHRHVS